MNLDLLKSIFKIAIIWLLFVAGLTLLFATQSRANNVLWAIGIWFFCSAGFFGTASVGQALIRLRMEENPAERSRLSRGSIFALGLKLACFSLLGMVVWAGREKAMTGILVGISTLVVVPMSWALVSFRQK